MDYNSDPVTKLVKKMNESKKVRLRPSKKNLGRVQEKVESLIYGEKSKIKTKIVAYR